MQAPNTEAELIQAQKELGYMRSYCFAISRNLDTAIYIKERFKDGDIKGAAEAWYEMDERDQKALYMAPTKGGFLSTKERSLMKSGEFRP